MTPAVGLCAQLACMWEATARKPGNVHRFADFDDVTYLDFLTDAAAIAPVFDAAPGRRVGETVLAAVRATRQVVGTNTNLGMVLLLAPLAAVPVGKDVEVGIAKVLGELDVADATAVYEAIRIAAPGGLGKVDEEDVRADPTRTLGAVMALAADQDLVARQYVNGFREVLGVGTPALLRGLQRPEAGLEEAIVGTHLHLMAHYPDSLIGRKRGREEAEESARRAQAVLAAGWPDCPEAGAAAADLDAWLRAAGRGRNPGTTADLVTASLFVLLRRGAISLPASFLPPATAAG